MHEKFKILTDKIEQFSNCNRLHFSWQGEYICVTMIYIPTHLLNRIMENVI